MHEDFYTVTMSTGKYGARVHYNICVKEHFEGQNRSFKVFVSGRKRRSEYGREKPEGGRKKINVQCATPSLKEQVQGLFEFG